MSGTQSSGGRWKRIPLIVRIAVIVVVGGFILYQGFVLSFPGMLRWYVGDKVTQLTYPNQDQLTEEEFEALASLLEEGDLRFLELNASDLSEGKREYYSELADLAGSRRFSHIERFREAGITTYEGPQTCLQCHETMSYRTPDGETIEVNTMDDVMNTVHYRLFSDKHQGFSTYGYDGTPVNAERTIPVGKIDRACGIPGSFTWTGWAALIEARPEHGEPEMRSDGCGQCHIGGGYGPPSEEMMPIVFREEHQRQGIDCLICHSQTYDMNERYVFDDGVGLRWNQDRSLAAAMTVGTPTQEGCLHCHQHNMGGDSYPFNEQSRHPGYQAARLLHEGAKRGTPFTPDVDVHAAAGMVCLDCHTSVGHRIARGNKGVDLVSNDLPGVDVSCESCHSDDPHMMNEELMTILNQHTDFIACETCHITQLWEDNLVLVDWLDPVWNEEEGIYTPRNVLQTGEMTEAVEYLWFNGNGTFLANALGDNPYSSEEYMPLMDQIAGYDKMDGLEIPGIEGTSFLAELSPEMVERREAVVRENLLPIQRSGHSKIYPFKLFNARMYEDMNNQGPFGAMILPFDYKTYYETGDAYASMRAAVDHTIVRRMYQAPFKAYMMDEFMRYFGVGEWTASYPLDEGNEDAIEGHWMRQMGTLMINHGITRDGRTCVECHTEEGGILDFARLGYSPLRVRELQDPSVLQQLRIEGVRSATTVPDRPVHGYMAPNRH